MKTTLEEKLIYAFFIVILVIVYIGAIGVKDGKF